MTREHHLVFGPFLLDPTHKQLWRGGERVALQPQPVAVLHQLVLHAGRVVPSGDLLRHAWGSTHVSRTTLKGCIRAVRIALGDDAERPRYVETVGRQGYRFLIVGSAPPAQRNADGGTVVGRAAALAELERWAAQAQQGNRQLVFVTGEPGIGKTTIVDLVLDRIAATGPVAIGRGQCLEQTGAGEAYLPVLEALGQLCRAPGGPMVIDILRRSAPTWLVQMPALIPEADVEALQRKVAGATRERMLREMAETLDVVAAEQLLVLVFEDLHWSDHSTVELLAYVAQRRERARLLLLATYRPVDLVVREHPLLDLKHALQSHGQCVELPLELLAEDEVAEYLSHRLGTESVPEGLTHTLHRRTDGNPMFVVTLLDDYLARGKQTGPAPSREGEVTADDGDVPPTLQETIARQIARRSSAARAVLEAASVAGMEFSVAAVAAGLALEPDAVEAVCEDLAREGHFLREAGVAEWHDGTVSGRFAFRHILYQQVLYQQMAPARRLQMHRRIGEREEAGYGERTGEIAARLAVHFTHARDLERAVRYRSRAGETELRRSAYPEAIRQFTDGIELVQTLPESPEHARQELIMQAALASALMVTKGRAHEIVRPCARALELTNQVRDEPDLLPVMDGLRTLHLARADLRSARELAERGLTIAQQSDDAGLRDAALYGVGAVALLSGEFALARERLEQVIAGRAATTLKAREIPTLHDPAVTSQVLAAVALWCLGFPDEAGNRARDAVRSARELGHPLTLGNVLVFTSVVQTCRHELDEVRQHAAELRTLATEHGFGRLGPPGTILGGWGLVHQQQVEQGLAWIREGLASYEATSLLLFRPWYLALLAQALASAGRIDEALDTIDTAIASVDRTGERWCAAELYRIRGEVSLMAPEEGPVRRRRRPQGRALGARTAAAAEACFRTAIDTARRQAAKSWELRAATSLSRLRQRQGRVQEAREALADVYGWFGEGFDTPDLAAARSLVAEDPPLRATQPRATSTGLAAPQGERRQLTVVFSDLVGSTELSTRADPEEWREIVTQYQKTAAAAVAQWGGHVARELGDGLLVYFGWPDAREDDAERAVRAGLAIVDALAAVNATRTAGEETQLAVRVGMHTGLVVIADSGEAFGETLNVSARVQAAAAPNTVFITAATLRLVAGMFVVEDCGPRALRGVPEAMTLYRVLRPSGVRSRLDAAAGRLTGFVGRAMELGTLVERWERAAEGEGQNVLLVGEAGVGKSRLVYHLRERLAGVPHTWLECRATPYTEGTPFFPVLEWVQQGLALGPKDTPDEQLRKIERGLGAVGFARDEGVPLVAAFLGVPSPETYPPLQMSPDLQRRKTMELLAAWILGLGERQPLVLLMEDLHWSDPSSLELLGRLIAQSPTARVLLLGTARPDFQPPWPARSNLTTLQLTRLTKRQAREMVMTLGGSALRAEMVETLVGRADGVPLYIEELTRAVLEPGAARTAEAIPATLADSLMDRLDRLSTAKEVAQRAAVLGREFSYALLAAAAGLEEAVLQQGLTRLIEGEIVFVRGEPPSATYTFKEALVQEAAYGSLLKTMRQQLHANVVDVLLDQFPMKAASEPEVVARHAEAAGRIDEAITHLQRAGVQAQERSAHAEAMAHFRKGIGLLELQADGRARDAREVRMQLSLGASLAAARGFAHPETEAAYERARPLAERLGDAARLGIARIGLSTVYGNRGEIERGRALAAEVLAAAEARGDAEQALIAHNQVAVPEHYQGQFASSLAHCERTLTLYEPAQHHDIARVLSWALGYMAWNLWHLGRPDRALARAEEAVARARRLTHPFSLAFALFFEAAIHWSRRDHARQQERAAEVIALSEAQGFPLWLGLGRAWHVAARMAAGDAGAQVAIADGLALAGETGSQVGAPALFGLLAEAQHAAGQLAAAQATVATGLAIAAQTGQPFWDAELHRLDGELLLASGGAPEEVAARYQHALAIARTQVSRGFELRAATSLARLLRDQGSNAAARDALTPVYAWFTEGFDTGDLVAAKALLEPG